jgi:hypothetical protein
MANPRHSKDKPLYPTRQAVTIIIAIAAVLGILIYLFLVRPLDVSTVGHAAQHVHPNTGKIIARAPEVKVKVTEMSHALHMWHLRHMHMLHMHHLAHLAYVKYVTGAGRHCD